MDESIRTYALYGESGGTPDLPHGERLAVRSAAHDWRIAPHRHSRLHQVFVITSGAVDLDADGRAQALRAPALINLPPRSVHGFRFAPESDGFVLSVPTDALPEVFGFEQPLGPRLARVATAVPDPELVAAMARFLHWQGRTGFARSAMLQALAVEVLGLTAVALDAAVPLERSGADRLYQRFEALVTRHLRDGWRVSDHAAALAVTPAHLTRVARWASGRTASRVIEEAVMAEAARELAYTTRPVGQIAFDLGFQDAAYFARSFRRATGLAPRDYRKRTREGA